MNYLFGTAVWQLGRSHLNNTTVKVLGVVTTASLVLPDLVLRLEGALLVASRASVFVEGVIGALEGFLWLKIVVVVKVLMVQIQILRGEGFAATLDHPWASNFH